MQTGAIDTYKRLLGYLKKRLGTFIVGITSMVVIAATEVGLPAILQPILDGTFVNKDPFFLKWAPIGLIILFAIRGSATLVSNAAFAKISTNLMHELRSEMFVKLIHLPVHFFNTHLTGNLVSKFTYDVSQISQAGVDVLNTIVKDSLTVVALFTYIVWLDWQLSLFMLIMIPTTGLIAKYIGRRQKALSEELQTNFGAMTHRVDESVRGHEAVKIFNGHTSEAQSFKNIAKQVRQKQFKLALSSKLSIPIVEFIGAIVMAGVLYIGTQRASIDQLTVGEFVAFFTALGLLFSPIKRLTKLTHPINMGLAAARSVFNLIDQNPETDTGDLLLDGNLKNIEFRNASFKYPDTESHALRNINLSIPKGSTIAFVGKSGGGKTTLANLIPRFYNVTSGQILLNGIELNQYSITSLRKQISYVSQKITLFNGTVAENIAYPLGRNSIDVLDAAIAAHADEFIRTLPEGYNTQLGENGAILSGGQRHRIALARALYKKTPILILDEATSALDNSSEKEIQKALEEIKGNLTIIIIAHRLSTIAQADKIAVFEEGCIVEYGSFKELNKANTYFARLLNSESTSTR